MCRPRGVAAAHQQILISPGAYLHRRGNAEERAHATHGIQIAKVEIVTQRREQHDEARDTQQLRQLATAGFHQGHHHERRADQDRQWILGRVRGKSLRHECDQDQRDQHTQQRRPPARSVGILGRESRARRCQCHHARRQTDIEHL